MKGASKGNNRGRPKSKLDLPNDWKKKVLELYSIGASDVEIKALIHEWRGSFSNDLWDRWMNEEREFSETIKKGRLLSESWWQKQGRENLTTTAFNYPGWYMNMKNRFNWADKTVNTHKIKELRKSVDELFPPDEEILKDEKKD